MAARPVHHLGIGFARFGGIHRQHSHAGRLRRPLELWQIQDASSARDRRNFRCNCHPYAESGLWPHEIAGPRIADSLLLRRQEAGCSGW